MVLTKEEKKAKKDAKKLEKARQEEEFRKKLKRDELTREITALNIRRSTLEKVWRETMLKIKEPVFKQDMEVMWHVFERSYDKKNYLIHHIVKLINVADDQFQRTVVSFCDTIDRMINKFLEDLEIMAKDNERRTADVLKKGEDDIANVMQGHHAAETHLQLLLYHSHSTADGLAWTLRGENLVRQDEDRTRFEDERENLRSYLENTFNATWEEYKAILRAYVVGTAENQKQVRKLRRKENVMADIINSQGKKIANSDGQLKKLRMELGGYESGTKQAAFRERRDRHRDACYRLKKNMYNGVATDVKHLARLVKVSDEAVEWLEAAFKKVEKILRIAALCRKFETRREKVLPYGSNPPHSPSQTKSPMRRQVSDESFVVSAMSVTTGLTRLWQKISKAELTKRALYREKMLLEQENEFLSSRLEVSEVKEMTPDSKKCICTSELRVSSKSVINRPVAIDGSAEVVKNSLQSIHSSQYIVK